MSPKIPNMNGTIVRQLPHGSFIPPREMATRNEVMEAIKRPPPSQSTRFNLVPKVSVFGLSVRSNGMVTKPMKQNGNMR